MKEQWSEATRGSRLAAVYYTIIDAIEEIALEEGEDPKLIIVDERLLDASWLQAQLEYGDIRIRASVNRKLELEALGSRIVIEPDPGVWGVALESVYRLVPRIVISSDSYLLKRLAGRTTSTGIEYLILYPAEGEAIILEGEYFRVSVPFARVVASIHTHPEGPCGLSLKDVESALDLLAEGGLFEAAVTTSCAATIYRLGPVMEDDYIAVREVIVSKKIDYSKIMKLKTIVLEHISY